MSVCQYFMVASATCDKNYNLNPPSVNACALSGVIERWELLQAQSRSDQHAGPQEPQRLTSDLDDITSWLENVIPALESLRQSDPAVSIEDMAARAKELKVKSEDKYNRSDEKHSSVWVYIHGVFSCRRCRRSLLATSLSCCLSTCELRQLQNYRTDWPVWTETGAERVQASSSGTPVWGRRWCAARWEIPSIHKSLLHKAPSSLVVFPNEEGLSQVKNLLL